MIKKEELKYRVGSIIKESSFTEEIKILKICVLIYDILLEGVKNDKESKTY